MTSDTRVTMGICADQAMITWFGWSDVWGPRGRLRVEMNNLKREVLCSYMICEVKIMLLTRMCICSKYGFDIIISEGIIYYALELCYL